MTDDTKPRRAHGHASRGFERRTTPRHEARLAVRFHDAVDLARAVKTYTKNVGLGGLCLRTRREYAIGAELHLVLQFDASTSMEVQGKVAWCRRGVAIGVRFDELSDYQHSELARLLDRAIGDSEPE